MRHDESQANGGRDLPELHHAEGKVNYVIGKYYRVPTVRAELKGIVRDWPIIGPYHSDVEHIPFEHKHYHVDWRFVPMRVRYKLDGDTGRIFGMVIYDDGNGSNTTFKEGTPVVIKKLRRCKFDRYFPFLRRHSRFDVSRANYDPTFSRLVAAYQNAPIGPHKQCPHQGAPLETVEPVCGVIVCPLHGLCFDAKSGKALSPKEAEQRINEHVA
jgi:nitrite reductase/ring-hydroxylating ferredoxin subunit